MNKDSAPTPGRRGRVCPAEYRGMLLPAERVAALYCLLTLVLLAILFPRLSDPAGMLLMRLEWLALTVALIALDYVLRRYLPSCHRLPASWRTPSVIVQGAAFLRVAGQMSWLGRWYPDTYGFNSQFRNLDHLFAAAEQSLFGCQPALEFSRAVPQQFWSEAFNLGYWSYFPMIITLTVVVFISEFRRKMSATGKELEDERGCCRKSPFHRVATIILIAFFLYYIIYIFLPVAGPQFYYLAVGTEAIEAGHFPAIGTYFSTHTEMLPAPGYADGLFYHLVHLTQMAGERPTAAFPSSHIGISTLVLLLSRRHAPRLTPLLLPLWALLCCATVYIQAHYLIDALAGLLSAPIVLWVSRRLASRL